MKRNLWETTTAPERILHTYLLKVPGSLPGRGERNSPMEKDDFFISTREKFQGLILETEKHPAHWHFGREKNYVRGSNCDWIKHVMKSLNLATSLDFRIQRPQKPSPHLVQFSESNRFCLFRRVELVFLSSNTLIRFPKWTTQKNFIPILLFFGRKSNWFLQRRGTSNLRIKSRLDLKFDWISELGDSKTRTQILSSIFQFEPILPIWRDLI